MLDAPDGFPLTPRLLSLSLDVGSPPSTSQAAAWYVRTCAVRVPYVVKRGGLAEIEERRMVL